MNKLYDRYIAFLYIKNFLIIFLALEFFYVGIDLLSNLKNLPISANLQLLYIYFNVQIAINYTLPISLVIAMIVSKISMIKSNELISLYSSTISKNQVIMPTFIASCSITLLLIVLNCTSFTYANNYKNNLIKYNTIQVNANKVFMKFNNNYVFIEKLNPVKKEAANIEIFEIRNARLKSITSAKKAYFKENAWHSDEVDMLIIPEVKKLGDRGLIKKTIKNQIFLKGFKPKTMNTIHKSQSFLNIIDAYDAFIFLNKQQANTTHIRSSLYNFIFFPLFAPLLVIILFYFLPLSARFFNLALLSFIFILITLLVWGSLFLLSKFAQNGVISPEIGIILPILLMSILAFRLYKKNSY